MGKKIVLTGVTLTDPDAPRLLSVDPIESAGSLLLLDPMHPTQQWASGAPADLDTVPNLLSAPLSTGATATVRVRGGILAGGKGALERSTKGGLHGIVSQSVALASDDGMAIEVPAALAAYISANLDHSYYVSVWDRLTRALPNPTNFTVDYATGGSTTTNGLMHAAQSTWYGAVSAVSNQDVLGNTVGARFANASIGGSKAVSSTATRTPCWGAPASSPNNTNLATRNLNWPSFVFYRLYMEDLTVSGRTYAEVHAIDYQQFTKHVLTPGGRYYGDTFTDPATIP